MKRLFYSLILCMLAVTAMAQPSSTPKNRAFFEGIKYQWPFNAPASAQQQSNLGEIATNPDQIIAMLRTVYMDQTIPGNYTRGYSAVGVNEGTWSEGVATGNYPVAYPGVGTIAESNGAYGYNDAYGWGITGGFKKVAKNAVTVTFDASVEDDCTNETSITKDGIKLEMANLAYRSSTPRYYWCNAKGNIKLTSLNGYEISKVEVVMSNSAYVSYISDSEPTGTLKSNGETRTWTGSATTLILKNPNYRIQVAKIVVTYQMPGATTSFSKGETSAINGYTTGSKSWSSAVSTDHSQGTQESQNYNTKAPITILAYNLNRSLGYAVDTKGMTVKCEDGYLMTRIKFTFDGASGLGKIATATYISSTGESVELTALDKYKNSNSYTFDFDIPTSRLTIKPSSSYSYITKVEVDYKYVGNGFDGYLNASEYTPSEEGNTVLLVEVKDGADITKLGDLITTRTKNGQQIFDYYNINDYESLRAVVDASIKSVRVLTEAKRMGSGIDAGTLFKIDCDKLNRFFLLGKGQLRWFNNDYKDNDVNANYPTRNWEFYTDNQPYHTTYGYYDQSMEYLFGHMFEQFSPSMANGGASLNDIYKLLAVNMESFNVVHDCIDVFSAEGVGHEFNMYGKESPSEDCQDVRDLMFFVPDYRMLAHEGNADVSKRDPNKAQKFLYYNPDHAPKMGLFVIKLDEITEDKAVKVEGENAYDVTLTWNSNLLNFLPGEDGVYTLYRVTNVDGVETYTPVKDGNGNDVTITANTQAGLTYTDRIAQLPNEGQTITYAVRGRDAGNFLSLQMSNKESVYIPGIDVSEDLNLKLTADYYSRFDPQEEKNNYSNLVTMGTVVSNITSAELQQGTLTFTRSYTDATGAHTVPIAVGTVTTMSNGRGTMKMTMQNQEFFKFGYNSNGTASANAPNPTFNAQFTYNANGVTFTGDGIKFYDNFSASVAGNAHPSKYTYQVNFVFGDKYANSNTMDIYVHKTQLVMDPEGNRTVSQNDINDEDEIKYHSLPANGPIEFGIDVKYSSKSEILRYDAYRWTSTAPRYIIEPSSTAANEQDVAPNGIAGNQGTYYTTAMNAVAGDDVPVTEGQTAQAIFSDPYPVTNIGTYLYAPVVETFAPNENRSDYNTYGAPLQEAATGTINVSVKDPVVDEDDPTLDYSLMSGYTWEEANGDKYAYYNIYLQVDQSSIPAGYKIYKVRAWRKVDPSILGEKMSEYNYRMGIDGEFMYEELEDVELGDGDLLGITKKNGVLACTFGARKLRTSENETGVIDDLTAEFVVRIYFTPDESTPTGAPMLKSEGDAKYYVMEGTTERTFNWTEGVVTGVARLTGNGIVESVTYYNVAGAASPRPWQGINIMVTRYSDGTVTKTKVIK